MPDCPELIAEGTTYQIAGMLDKALQRFEAAARAASTPAEESGAIRRQADVLRTRCEWDAALSRAHKARQIAEESELCDAAAEALNSEAAVYHARGQLERACELYEQMLSLSNDNRVRGIALQNLGTIAAARKDHALAEIYYRDSFREFRDANYHRGMTLALNNYGRNALERNDHELAEKLLLDAEELALRMNDFDLANTCMMNRAEAMLARGALDDADDLVSRAVGHFGLTGNQWRRLECLRLLGDIDQMRGNREEALLYYSAALKIAQSLDARLELEAIQRRMSQLGEISA